MGAPWVLDIAMMWPRARALIERIASAADRDALVDDCLDVLLDTVGADRGIVLLSDATGASVAMHARGRGRDLADVEREEISRTLVAQVLQTGRSVLWDGDLAATATRSMVSLGIFAAVAAPLRPVTLTAGASPGVGVVYVDFRDRKVQVGPDHVALLETGANLLSIVLDQRQRLELAREALREERTTTRPPGPSLEELLRHRSMKKAREELESCLHSDLPILLLGETGTGKTLLARAIADATGRAPVVRATLGNADDLNTITSELFGHERGSYSGALTKRVGLVEYADGGILILDEILNLPIHAQQLLLDFTQFGTFRPLGWPTLEPKRADVRVVAATNGDLRAAIASGRFREDLYHRLSVITLELPPLRARRDEIPALAEGTLRRIDPARPWTMTVELRRALMAPALTWPGNLRQLDGVIQRARLRALARDRDATELDVEHVDLAETTGPTAAPPTAPPCVPAPPVVAPTAPVAPAGHSSLARAYSDLVAERQAIDERERTILGSALDLHEGVVTRAAQEIGLARTSLISRLHTLGKK